MIKLFPLVLAFLAMTLSAAPPPDSPRIGGFVVGGHAWTFNQGTLFEALEQTKATGGSVLEVFLMGQKLSPEMPEVIFDENLSEEQLTLLKAKMQETGVRIINSYIGSKQWTRIEQNEAELRKIFDFGKKLGVTGFTGEPAERQWDILEKLLKEYDFIFSIHNHIKGFEAPYMGGEYKYWDPTYTYGKLEEQKRDARFGICLDTGHVARSGLDSLAILKKIGSRVNSAHLKDVVAADPDGHDCVYGTGIVDIRGILAELKRQEFKGHFAIEYEWFRSPTFVQDIQRCVEFIRTEGARL